MTEGMRVASRGAGNALFLDLDAGFLSVYLLNVHMVCILFCLLHFNKIYQNN